MVVPGVSGSMILMILGYYNPVIDCITGFIKALTSFNTADILHYTAILVPFGIGVVFGIFAIAKLIEILLRKFEAMTFSAILGLVVASPFAILMQSGFPTLGFANVIVSILTFAAGLFVELKLGKE